MEKLIKIPRRTSNRFLSWHDVIDKRGAYHATNANHAGRYYQMIHGIGIDDFLERNWHEPECVDYLIQNYVARDSVYEIIEDQEKSHKVKWKTVDKDTYECGNFLIKCRHMDYSITESMPLFGEVSLIQNYSSESMEDAFQFILNAILGARKNETIRT